MNTQKIWVIGGSIAGIILFLFISYKLTQQPSQQAIAPKLQKLKPTDHVSWSPKKKNILIEYSDLQCPACKTYHEYLSEIAKDKSIASNITFVYRHFPLDSIHPNSRAAAYAAESAGNQGAFFQMQDILFTKQTEWEKSGNPQQIFLSYAKLLKLNIPQFTADSESKKTAQRVQDDMLSGVDAQVDATPTFFLNGEKLAMPRTREALETLLKRAATRP